MIKIVEKIWGEERWIVNGDLYCAKHLVISPGFQCSLHYHRVKTETFHHAGGGVVVLEIDDLVIYLHPGDTSPPIKPGVQHRFSVSPFQPPATLLEISTHHEDSDVVRLEESREC